MISLLLYLRAKRNPRTPFERYLVAARDRGAWRGIVVGDMEFPWWLRSPSAHIAKDNVRILNGCPPKVLLLIDAVETAAQQPIRNVWPALRGYIHHTVAFEPYAATFRRRLGDGVTFVDAGIEEGYDLNAFGEQLTKAAMDAAVAAAREACGGEVKRYVIEPEFPTVTESRGRHVIRIECVTPPPDLRAFAAAVDAAMPHPARPLLREPIVRLVPGS